VRFIFVDRILSVEPGRSIVTLRGVSAAEDYFADHFPGCPIMPGALIVECFDQSVRLLVGIGSGFREAASLKRISRASFKRFVRPGDRLEIRCDIQSASETDIKVAARALLDGQVAAGATLDFAVSPVEEESAAGEEAGRLRDFYGTLMRDPVELAMRGVAR
jgi:3-hydroxyacyl-[acyl-carrier-protein] dehydratase